MTRFFYAMAIVDTEIKNVVLYVGTGFIGIILLSAITRRFGKAMLKQLRAYVMNRFCKSITKNVKNEKVLLFKSLGEYRDTFDRDIVICEIGSGSGMNFKHYPKGSELICVEPDEHAKPYVEENIRLRNPSLKLIDFVCCFAENMSKIEDNSVDVVVCTLVLCSVRNQKRAMSEVLRILRTDGRFYFMEHVADDTGTFRLKVQNWFTPVWTIIFDGCRLNADTRTLLNEAGFKKIELTNFMYRTVFWVIKPWIHGVAIK